MKYTFTDFVLFPAIPTERFAIFEPHNPSELMHTSEASIDGF